MEPDCLDLLRQEVIKNFGRKILSSIDCHYLSYDISRRLRTTLSFNTLRRFFNLMKAEGQPSVYTLNTLAAYCGFSSFDNFVVSKKQALGNVEEDPGVLSYLILLFRNTEVCDRDDATYASLVYQTISYLNNYPHLADTFQREIAKTKNGQNFYFEKFINVDKLNSTYGQGLHYYANEKTTREAQIFAHSLLCFRSFLTNDDAGVEKHCSIVMQYDKDTTTINPCFLGHFYAAQLYYALVTKKDPEPVLIKVCKTYAAINTTKSKHSSLFYFELTLSCALVLTGQYEECLFYAEEALKRCKSYSHSLMEAQLIESFELFRSVALAQTGKATEAKEAFERIDTSRFCALIKKFLTIIYLNLKQRIRKSTTEQEQIQYLVQETGFLRLLDMYPSFVSTKGTPVQRMATLGRLGQKNKSGKLYIRRSNQPVENSTMLIGSEQDKDKKA